MRRTLTALASSPTPANTAESVFVGSPADAEAAVRAGVAVVAALTDAQPDPVRRRYDVAAAAPGDLPADPAAWTALIPPLAAATDHVARIADRLRGRGWIGLDFDGTLSEIVADPDTAEAVPGALDVITDLTRTHRVAIVSGRSLADLRRRVPVPGVAYAGSHGSEIVDHLGVDMSRPISRTERASLDRARGAMERIVADLPGSELDEKPTAIAIHTRRAAESEALSHVFAAVTAELPPGLEALRGKEVVEVRLVGRHKGDVVDVLAGDADCAMYLGDDTTDEDAFGAVRRRLGVPIRVGADPDPATTWASLRLGSPTDALTFLRAFTTSP